MGQKQTKICSKCKKKNLLMIFIEINARKAVELLLVKNAKMSFIENGKKITLKNIDYQVENLYIKANMELQ